MPQINKPDTTKYGYLAFSHNGKQAEVWADTQLQARDLAIAHFKPPKSKRHLVTVHLCEKPGGEQVTHVVDF